MSKVTRTERGWAGHFICGTRCWYRRNTLLEAGECRVVVSTVGNMHLGEEEAPQKIGGNRYYETMAFEARREGVYWEADVEREVPFASPWVIRECEQNTDLLADAMHEAVVAELSDAIASEPTP